MLQNITLVQLHSYFVQLNTYHTNMWRTALFIINYVYSIRRYYVNIILKYGGNKNHWFLFFFFRHGKIQYHLNVSLHDKKINFIPTQITRNNIFFSDVREHVCVCVWCGRVSKAQKSAGGQQRIIIIVYKYIIPEVPI